MSNMKEEFITDTDDMVCPYCGHEHDDMDLTLDRDYDKFDCENCGKTFQYSRETSHIYTTTVIE